MTRLTSTAALAILAAILAGAPVTFAQDQPGQEPESEAPAMDQDEMQDMMGGGDIMGMMNMMTQMNEMMGACTKMMQAMTPGEGMPDEGEEPGNSG